MPVTARPIRPHDGVRSEVREHRLVAIHGQADGIARRIGRAGPAVKRVRRRGGGRQRHHFAVGEGEPAGVHRDLPAIADQREPVEQRCVIGGVRVLEEFSEIRNAIAIEVSRGRVGQIPQVGEFPGIGQAVAVAIQPQRRGGAGDTAGTVDEHDGVLAFVGGPDVLQEQGVARGAGNIRASETPLVGQAARVGRNDEERGQCARCDDLKLRLAKNFWGHDVFYSLQKKVSVGIKTKLCRLARDKTGAKHKQTCCSEYFAPSTSVKKSEPRAKG